MAEIDVLQRVRVALGKERKGRFCFECGDPEIEVESTEAGEHFVCPKGHTSQRAFDFDGKAIFRFVEGRMIHESVGAVVKRRGKTLLFRRRHFPIGLTIPAGHLEEDVAPEEQMRREVQEEVGLTVLSAEPLWPDEDLLFEDKCRRGADQHRWHVFAAEVEGMVQLNDEGADFGWYDDDEIRGLADTRMLVRATKEIFSRLGLVTGT